MLYMPSKGRRIYEAAIYNKEVRALVKENRSHVFFEDHWADVQRRNVAAKDEKEARSLIAECLPPEDVFIIQDLFPEPH